MLKKNFPQFLEGNSVKWNFTKFLIDGNGNIDSRYEPTTEPLAISSDIERLLGQLKQLPLSDEIGNNKIIYTGEDDEEVLNCEGKPCNFVYHDENE